MKRLLIWILATGFLVTAVSARDNGWPDELTDVQRMVHSTVGDIPYDRVKVRREGNVVDVSIKLRSTPRRFRAMARQRSGDEDVFLATNLNAFSKPDLDFSQDYALTPSHLIDYYFGFGVFNFGKRIKREAKILVDGPNGVEFENTKKKYKLRKKSVQIRFVEEGVSGPGLYALETSVGPFSFLSWFCASCT